MKIAFASDLHLEFGPCKLVGTGDILVLAGDTVIVDDIKRFPFNNTTNPIECRKFGNSQGYREFLEEVSERFKLVVLILGNHEHYNGRLNESYQILKSNIESNFTNIKVLENEAMELDHSTVLLAATLWTNFNNLDQECIFASEYWMNDYRKISYKQGTRYRNLAAKDTISEHYNTIRFFEAKLNKHKTKKVIVATHHAPSMQSTLTKELPGAYGSDLEEFIVENPQIHYWIHGHVHSLLDYQVGNCRVLCNPRGYYGHEHYDIDHTLKVIEV